MLVKETLEKNKVPFRESGGDFLVSCLNPEHPDLNPSMRIDKLTGIFNCLSCGFKGNIFAHFGEKINGVGLRRDKLQALITEKLASTVGMGMPEGFVLFNSDYRGIKAELFNKFGAFRHNEYIGRIMFPIKDASGKILAFCGRTEPGVDGPKYMFYPTGAKLPLFPTVKPRSGSVILVEGIFDMMKMHSYGLEHTMCCWGVNKVDEAKINLLKIQGVHHVDIAFDSDEAGQEGAAKLAILLEKHEISYKIIDIDPAKDPGDIQLGSLPRIKEQLYAGSPSGDQTIAN
jgi:DNA primase